jgi:Fe-S oxidoreductase
MQKKNYELSSAISQSLKDSLESATTKNVLTECAACKMQIEHLSGTTTSHPIKVLGQAYSSSRQ